MKGIHLILIGLMVWESGYGQTPITTVEEFAALNESMASLAGSYILMNDLTLENWMPVGGHDNKDGKGFSGTFDGNGHTITITGFDNSSDNTRIGLFGTVEKEGIVKNLCITGNIKHTSKQKILYIGGIAGLNYGLIACCAAKITMEGSIYITEGKPESAFFKGNKVITISGYEGGACGGGIAGINKGVIKNCYSTGSISISGNRPGNYAGGIAGGNGEPVKTGISVGVNVNSGGGVSGGINATPGVIMHYHSISHCYSTVSVFSKFTGSVKALSIEISQAWSGGVSGFNQTTGIIEKTVSLNETIEASGEKNTTLSATPTAPFGLTNYRRPDIFYRDDMVTCKYKNGKERKLGKPSGKNAVSLLATQEQSWWRYSEELTEKERNKSFGFLFGDNEQSPWTWNNETKRPVLYWEKSDQK